MKGTVWIALTVQENEDEPILLVGDFNAHTGQLGEPTNKNGKMLEKLIENHNLINLNSTPECKGKITWQARGLKSAIDYALMNRKSYKFFKEMSIDEEKDIFDLSDHCIIDVTLSIKKEGTMIKKEKIKIKCLNEERLEKFSSNVEQDLREIDDDIINMQTVDNIMEKAAKEHLEITVTKKGDVHEKGSYEPVWINDGIKREIKTRRKFNKLKRNNMDPLTENYFSKKYEDQKQKVKTIVKEAINKHEQKITNEIKEDRNRKLWDNINYLRGKNSKNNIKETKIYEDDGEKIPQHQIKDKVGNFWKDIYQHSNNSICETWVNDKENYKATLDSTQMTVDEYNFPFQLQEHIDYFMQITPRDRFIRPMEEPKITGEDVKRQTNKMKNKKSPGPNNLSAELYKSVIKSETSLEKITKSMNNTINKIEIPQNWYNSKTKLIPKTSKPKIKDFRPIALTDCSYKICMGIMRSKMEQHLKNNSLDDHHQFGFTPRRRTTDSTYILSYTIEHCFKEKKTLIITSIDFKKAFDSVQRDKLLEAMMKYKIHPKVIDLIIKIYSNDTTALVKDREEIDTIQISSGIRQGCNGSTVLFLLITYIIIEELTQQRIGVRINNINIATLFFADDGLLLTNNTNDATRAINKLEEVAMTCGLHINKDKSANIINLNRDNINQISDIKVTQQIKYLGILINEGRNCFRNYKKDKVLKSKHLANMIMPVVARSSNKFLIGKTYWKNVALSEILYGSEIIPYNQEELRGLQRSENSAYRQILGAPRYTPTCTLRGEIGSSDMTTRDKINKVKYMQHSLLSENLLLKEVAEDDLDKKITKAAKITGKYLDELGMSKMDLRNKTPKQIEDVAKNEDTVRWREEILSKATLEFYSNFKNTIKEEELLYDNTEESVLLFRARTNTLPLNWRKRFQQNDENESTLCPLCSREEETLAHFLLSCQELMSVRRKYECQNENNSEEILRKILCFNLKIEGRTIIRDLWITRKKKMEQIQTQT